MPLGGRNRDGSQEAARSQGPFSHWLTSNLAEAFAKAPGWVRGWAGADMDSCSLELKVQERKCPENDHHLRGGGKRHPECLPSGSALVNDALKAERAPGTK